MEHLLEKNRYFLDEILKAVYRLNTNEFDVGIDKAIQICKDVVHDIDIDESFYIDNINISEEGEKHIRVSILIISDTSGSHIFYENIY